jgi:hypothetical protein
MYRVLVLSHIKEKVKAVCYNLQTYICTYIFLRCNLTKLIFYLDVMNNGNVTLSPTAYDTCSLSPKLEEKNYVKTIVVLKKCTSFVCVCQLLEVERRAGSLTVYAGECKLQLICRESM